MGILKKFNQKAVKRAAIGAASLPLLGLGSSAPPPDPYQDLPTAQELIETSGNLLTREQAENRAEHARTRFDAGLSVYTDTRTQSALYYQNCFQMDYTPEQVPDTVRAFYNYTYRLSETRGLIAQGVMHQAQSADLFFCFSDQMPATTNAVWKNSSTEGVVSFNRCTNYSRRMKNTLIHEVLHSIQEDNGVNVRPTGYSIYDRQINTMSMEAASRVLPRLYEFELYLAGAHNEFLADGTDRRLDQVILRTYQNSTQNGNSHRRALENAGSAAWQEVFEMQWWLDGYNQSVISSFIRDYQAGNLKAQNENRYDLGKARRSGILTETFNFTRDIQNIPDIQTRIGSNTRVRYIFQLLEIAHHEQTLGVDSTEYQTSYQAAQAENNPYLNVNLNDVNRDSRVNIYTQINNLAEGGTRAPDAPQVSLQRSLTSRACS